MENTSEFVNDLKKTEKIFETVYMIIVANRKMDRLALELLKPQILKNLEEIEDIIPYESTIESLLDIRNDYRDRLLEKYKDESHAIKSHILHLDDKDSYIDNQEKSYNLVKMTDSDNSYNWWYELLKSKLSLETRSLMFIDMMVTSYDIDSFLSCAKYYDVEEEIKEVLNNFNENQNLKRYAFIKLLKNNDSVISYMQEKGYLDFTNICGDAYQTLSTVLVLSNSDTLTDTFDTIFNNISEVEKKDIIAMILNKKEKNVYIAWDIVEELNFKVTKDIIEMLSNHIRNNFEENQEKIDYLREKISTGLIKKASNKEELKEYEKHVKHFLNQTDYQKYLNQQELKRQELATKRKELSTLLYNLNDKLQEEVPGKTIIKNINFKN